MEEGGDEDARSSEGEEWGCGKGNYLRRGRAEDKVARVNRPRTVLLGDGGEFVGRAAAGSCADRRVHFCWGMIKGQKVVCVNDTFTPTIRALSQQLPVKDNIYTIREVFLGREKIVKGGDSATVGLLLSELSNPPDTFNQGKQELGFTSERFAPMEELPPEEAVASEGELVGAGAEKHQGGYWSS